MTYVAVTYKRKDDRHPIVATIPEGVDAVKWIAESWASDPSEIEVVGSQPVGSIPCQTTTHWETHIAAPCAPFGGGQCDGYCEDHGRDCTCSCHGDWDLPSTVDEVRKWHDDMHAGRF